MNQCWQGPDDDWDIMAMLSVMHRCGYEWQLRPGRQNVLMASSSQLLGESEAMIGLHVVPFIHKLRS